MLGVASSCNEPSQPASQAYEVHIQAQFTGTWVQFDLDGQQVSYGNQTTSPLIGLASIVRLNATAGRHLAHVRAGESEATLQFDLASYQYVLVSRELDGTLHIQVTSERPLYD